VRGVTCNLKEKGRNYKFSWEYNIKMGVKVIGWIGFFCLKDWWQTLVNRFLSLWVL